MNGSISMWCSIKYLSVLWGQELDYTGHLTYVEGEAVQQKTKWCLLRYNDCFTTEILVQKNPHLFLHILDFKCQLDMADTGIYLSFHLSIHPSFPPSFLSSFFFFLFFFLASVYRGKNAYIIKSRQLEKPKLKGRRCFHVQECSSALHASECSYWL